MIIAKYALINILIRLIRVIALMGLQSHFEAKFGFLGAVDGINGTLIWVWKRNIANCIFLE